MASPQINLLDAGARLSIRVYDGDAREMLDPAQYRVAMQLAISETLTFGRKIAAQLVRDEVNLSAKDAKKAMALKRPSLRSLTGLLDVSRRPIPLGAFKPQQFVGRLFGANVFRNDKGRLIHRAGKKAPKLVGLTVQVRKGGPRELIRGAHLWQGKVLARKTKAGRKTGRNPRSMMFGPTAVGVLANAPGLLGKTYQAMNDEVGKRLDSKIDGLLRNPGPFAKLLERATKIVERDKD